MIMALNLYLSRIQRLDILIRKKSTGSPKELAEKLGISERWLFHLLDEIREELDCPIRYNRLRRSYEYEKPGKVMIGFLNEAELDIKSLKSTNGGHLLHSTYLYIQ